MTRKRAALEVTVAESAACTAYWRGPFAAKVAPDNVAVITLPLADTEGLVKAELPSSSGTEEPSKCPIRITVWLTAVAGDPRLELSVTWEEVCEPGDKTPPLLQG